MPRQKSRASGKQRQEPRTRFLARAARASVDATAIAGMEAYDRARHLPRLLPIGPDELADEGIVARGRIVARLARALRAERNRGRAGHWTYDLNRHIALRQAYAAERAELSLQAARLGAMGLRPPPSRFR